MHLTYLGDATIGENTNIGAGTVTCNYDGVRKHETIIEDNVKIGSDTMLVAPVRIGARSVTGAGSVVTKDVPPDSGEHKEELSRELTNKHVWNSWLCRQQTGRSLNY